MTDHEKRVREALADLDGFYHDDTVEWTTNVSATDLRALLADLDAMRGALFEAFQEGYWARSTYNDAETSDFQEEWNRSTAKDRALKGAEA